MLALVKLSLRRTSTAYDTQLTMLINAALCDLGISDITDTLLVSTTTDPLLQQAVITYCAMHFGNPDNHERFVESYKEQKAQLLMNSSYTDWGDSDDE